MTYTEILLTDFFELEEYRPFYTDIVKATYFETGKIASKDSRDSILNKMKTRYYEPVEFKGRKKTRRIVHHGLKPESEWEELEDERKYNKGGNNHLPYREPAEAVLSDWVRTIKSTNEKGRRQLWTPFSIVLNLGLFIDSFQMSKWATMSGSDWIYKKDYVSNKDILEKAIDELLIEYQQYFNALTPFEYAGKEYNGYLWKWQKKRLIRLYVKFFQDKSNDIVDKWVLKTPINHELYYLASVENIEISDEEREKLTFYNYIYVYIDEATFTDYKSWQANLKNLKIKDDEIEKRCRKKFGFNFAYKAYCFSNNDDQPECEDTQFLKKEVRNLLYERLIESATKANAKHESYRELSMDDNLSVKELVKRIQKEDVTYKLKRHREFLKLSKVIYNELINPIDKEALSFDELEQVSEGTPDGFSNERIKEKSEQDKAEIDSVLDDLLSQCGYKTYEQEKAEQIEMANPFRRPTEPFIFAPHSEEEFEEDVFETTPCQTVTLEYIECITFEESDEIHQESKELERMALKKFRERDPNEKRIRKTPPKKVARFFDEW